MFLGPYNSSASPPNADGFTTNPDTQTCQADTPPPPADKCAGVDCSGAGPDAFCDQGECICKDGFALDGSGFCSPCMLVMRQIHVAASDMVTCAAPYVNLRLMCDHSHVLWCTRLLCTPPLTPLPPPHSHAVCETPCADPTPVCVGPNTCAAAR
jgi:hypothetical protein